MTQGQVRNRNAAIPNQKATEEKFGALSKFFRNKEEKGKRSIISWKNGIAFVTLLFCSQVATHGVYDRKVEFIPQESRYVSRKLTPKEALEATFDDYSKILDGLYNENVKGGSFDRWLKRFQKSTKNYD